MTCLMLEGWKLRWYDHDRGKVNLTDHLALMFGCKQCQSIQGFLAIDDSGSTRCPIKTITLLKECMLHNALIVMYWCIPLADIFDYNEEWLDVFFNKKHVSP